MDALSNARTTGINSGKGPAPFTPPKARHSKTGVSVEYVQDTNKRWFALRASYGRAEKAADLLIGTNHYVYIAQRYEWRIVNGRRCKELRELIPNILFAYIVKDDIKALLSRIEERPSPMPELAQMTTFYYNHFAEENGRNPPLEIPEVQMRRLIEFTASKDENIVYVNDNNIVHVKNNDYVLVQEGKFKGCIGKVVRIAGQQRVGLQLAELGWVATSYVPTAFLRIITQEEYDTHLNDLASNW